jgi:hypothetical protein
MLKRSLWHKGLMDEVIMDAVRRQHFTLDNPGFCLICGAEASGVEPDAENYECEACGSDQVFGAEQLLFEIG